MASFSGQGVNFGLPLLSFVKSHWFTKSRDRFKFCTPSKFFSCRNAPEEHYQTYFDRGNGVLKRVYVLHFLVFVTW